MVARRDAVSRQTQDVSNIERGDAQQIPLHGDPIPVAASQLDDSIVARPPKQCGNGKVGYVRSRARCVRGIDGVARITDDPRVIEDILRVGAVRGEEFRRYRELACPQDPFEAGTRPHSAHPAGRFVTLGLMSLIHDEVPSSRRSVGARTAWIPLPNCGIFCDRSQAATHTQSMSGTISQFPSRRTPPQGPLRRFFGQVMGHVMPVLCNTQSPHILQSNMRPFVTLSPGTNTFSITPPGFRPFRNRRRKASVANICDFEYVRTVLKPPKGHGGTRRRCSVVSVATNTIQYCCRRFQRTRLNPASLGPHLQTRQALATESRIQELGSHLDPIGAASGFLDADYPVLLDSALEIPGLGRYSYITADPLLVVRSKGRRVEILEHGSVTRLEDNPFSVVQRLLADFRTDRFEDGPSFQGGAIGYFGYEMGGLLERLPGTAVDDLALPDMSIGIYDWVIAFDHADDRAWLITTDFSEENRAQWALDRILQGRFASALGTGTQPLRRTFGQTSHENSTSMR